MINENNVSAIVSQKLCNSCGVCVSICPSNAIDFEETIGGYFFPQIDTDKCTSCGLCLKHCPGIHFGKDLLQNMPTDPFEGTALKTWIGTASNEEIYNNSQSGGIVTALLIDSLAKGDIGGAVVVTMGAGNPPRPKVVIARNREDIIKAQKSKYCPVPLLKIISEVEKLDMPVALVGLSCHMHGLSNYLEHRPQLKENIKYKIGLVCDRVMTYAAIDYLIKKSRLTYDGNKTFHFRDKSSRVNAWGVKVVADNGRSIVMPSQERMKIKDSFTPVRCRLCFDKMNIFSDVTLGDPHGVSGFDWKKGETLVIARTRKGLSLIESANSSNAIELREINYIEAVNGQTIKEKREEWIGYSEAWRKMGHDLPNYYNKVKQNAKLSDTHKYYRKLKFAMLLDRFNSRSKLFKFIDVKLRVEDVFQKMFSLYRFFVRALKKIKSLTKKGYNRAN